MNYSTISANGDPSVSPRGASGPVYNQFQVNPPQPLTLAHTSEWKIFKQQFDIYKKLTEVDRRDKSYQCALFLHCAGANGLKIYNGLTFSAGEDKEDLSTIITKFDFHIIGKTNEIYECYRFNKRNQESGETIDNYVSELKRTSKIMQLL